MSEKPTMETDAMMRGPVFRNGATLEELRLFDFARRLERERDEHKETAREFRDLAYAAMRERDALREALRDAIQVLDDGDDEGLIEHSESMIRWRAIAGVRS